MNKILLIEDDLQICEVITEYFTNKGSAVTAVNTGDDAIEVIENSLGDHDLVLLDIMLPGTDGFSLCRKIRRTCDIPVIFITAGGREEDVLYGYDLGCGKITLDTRTLRCFADGKEVELPPKEFAILRYLLDHVNWVVDRNKLLDVVWGYDYFGSDRVVDNHIKKLRKALGPAGSQIKTLVGRGYKLTE